MIEGKFNISFIDYDESFRKLFPKFIEKAESADSPGMVLKFFIKMGESSLPVIIKIMNYMNEAEKEIILLTIIGQFRKQICDILNQFLGRHGLGNAVRIGQIDAVKSDETVGFSLIARDVMINYDELLKSDFVNQNIDGYMDKVIHNRGVRGSIVKETAKMALKIGAKALSNELEKRGADLLNRADVNEKIAGILTDGLKRAGLCMNIKSINLEQKKLESDENIVDMTFREETRLRFPEEIEESLMDAVVKYLKESISV